MSMRPSSVNEQAAQSCQVVHCRCTLGIVDPTSQLEDTMATRKPKNPELAAAADSLAAAAHHVRLAVSKKVDALRASAATELAKGKRRLDAQLQKFEAKLTKTTEDAKKSVHKAVREAEKRLHAANKPAAKKAPAKKATAKKAAVKRAPARKSAG
jgi:hypothetical protein